MATSDPIKRLGLSIPYDWWPAAAMLKEIEAAGFAYVQVPSPPPSVLISPKDAARHAAALAEVLGTAGLQPVIHRPGSIRAGVVKDARGRGLQKRLIRTRVAYAKRNRIPRCYTYVWVANYASMRSLIDCGFRPYTYERTNDMTFLYLENQPAHC